MKPKLLTVLTLSLLMGFSTFALAADTGDLNGVGKAVTQQQLPLQEQSQVPSPPKSSIQPDDAQSKAQALADLYKNAGVDKESIAQAQAKLAPVARIINLLMAIILGLTSLGLFLITVLDLAYIAIPPARDFLNGGGLANQAGVATIGNLGMQGNMASMQGGNMRGQQTGSKGFLIRWISDEALAATMDSGSGQMGGGMPMGMMAMGMQNNVQQPVKSLIFSYMKKRAFFLVMFGITVVLFTSTVFSDLGIKAGMFILSGISGINF